MADNQGETDDQSAQAHPDTLRPRLLLADHAPTRVGIRAALGARVTVCAEVGDAEAAIRAAKREQPDIALVSTELTGDWRAAVRGMSRAAPGSAIVVLAQLSDPDDMLVAVRAGAVGYLPGPVDADRLRRIVSVVARGEAVLPRSMLLELLYEVRGAGSGPDRLTAREAEVLGMVRRGRSTADIAEGLQITPVTVRRHISDLVHKLGVGSRSDLAGTAGTRSERLDPDRRRVDPDRQDPRP